MYKTFTKEVTDRGLPRIVLQIVDKIRSQGFTFLIAAAMFMVLTVGTGADAQGNTPSPAAPQELVEQTAKKMIDALKAEKATIDKEPQRLYELVNSIVLPHFDFEFMAKRVLGAHWRGASPDQRSHFTNEFRGLLVRTYANSLNDYVDNSINYLPARTEEGSDRVTVRSEVARPGNQPLMVDYRLTRAGEGWKVYDVTIDGVSLVTNYRSSFFSEIDRGGLDALIKKLEARNKQEVAKAPGS